MSLQTPITRVIKLHVSRVVYRIVALFIAIAAFPVSANEKVAVFEFDEGGDFRKKVGDQFIIDQSPIQVLQNIVSFVLGIIGLVMIIIIIQAGFQWMTAGGSSERLEAAKKTILYAAMGLAAILLSYVISLLVFNLVTNPNSLLPPP